MLAALLKLQIDDEITGLAGAPEAVARFIPYHMGSARYANMLDAAQWLIVEYSILACRFGCCNRSDLGIRCVDGG
jgi:hypothetical protein